MAKKVLGDFLLPDEGDIIDQVAGQQEVQQLKAQADFLGLLTGWGFEVKKKGRGYKILCPFHEDTDPSCSIDPVKNVFHCFGCGKEGDIIRFVRDYRKVNFPGALAILRQSTGGRPAGKLSLVKKQPKPKDKEKEPPAAPQESKPPDIPQKHTASAGGEDPLDLDTVADYYHRKLLTSRKALAYLKSRGLTDHGLITRFRIGYCDGSLKSKASEAQQQELQRLGVLRESGREHLSGYVTFPLTDENGRVVDIYGRSVTAGTAVAHLFLPGKKAGVFNVDASKVYDEIILCESVLDALSLITAGLQNVQPVHGTNGLTDEHLQQLTGRRVKQVALALDNDAAGKQAAEKLAARFTAAGINIKRILPAGKDWNDDLAAAADPADLGKAVKKKLAEVPLQPAADRQEGLQVSKRGDQHIFQVGGITYRLRGVKAAFVSSLRVNIKAVCGDLRVLDNADLYSARSRNNLAVSISRMFELPEERIEKDLLAIVDWLEAERDARFGQDEPEEYRMTEEEIRLGMELNTSGNLFQRIVDDLSTLGYVGEDINKQLIYLAASSRKMADPISVMILSQSASGKSLLVETVRKLIPPEDVVAVSSLSDQALNYMGEGGLLHKFLILGEAVHSDVVDHQIREMLSGHELSRMVTCKNEKTGAMETSIIKTKVVVAAMLSSTRYDINPENASRCFLVNTDESPRQTRTIHQAQQRKYSLDRLCEKNNDIPAIIRQHHAAQRLLKSRTIINPYAGHLAFPDDLMRTRRDHDRFLDLIASVCFQRQYQKQEKEMTDPVSGEKLTYIECDLEDYRIAYHIMINILSSMYTQLPRSLITFYEDLRQLYRKKAAEQGVAATELSLTQREIRKEITRYGLESVKQYLRKLTGLEYLYRLGARQRGSRSSYRLVADETIEQLDCSMIPTPEELSRRIAQSG